MVPRTSATRSPNFESDGPNLQGEILTGQSIEVSLMFEKDDLGHFQDRIILRTIPSNPDVKSLKQGNENFKKIFHYY